MRRYRPCLRQAGRGLGHGFLSPAKNLAPSSSGLGHGVLNAKTRVQLPLGLHFRKPQVIGSRLASLGDQIVRFSGRKNQLAILLLGKENFCIFLSFGNLEKISVLFYANAKQQQS